MKICYCYKKENTVHNKNMEKDTGNVLYARHTKILLELFLGLNWREPKRPYVIGSSAQLFSILTLYTTKNPTNTPLEEYPMNEYVI